MIYNRLLRLPTRDEIRRFPYRARRGSIWIRLIPDVYIPIVRVRRRLNAKL